ncbi:histidine phosphatase family protein [bacterium]|nr:histidine phosphatase family protein [bacterium]
MKTLYLIRHAKSSWAEGGLSDFDRSLNKRGKRDALQMGKRLKALGVTPGVVISSPAKRAITTAQKISDELGYDRGAIVLKEMLYGAVPEETIQITQSIDDGHASAMMFGHNPNMTDLINELSSFQIDNVPTCGVFCGTFDVESWADVRMGAGTQVFFEYPKLMG